MTDLLVKSRAHARAKGASCEARSSRRAYRDCRALRARRAFAKHFGRCHGAICQRPICHGWRERVARPSMDDRSLTQNQGIAIDIAGEIAEMPNGGPQADPTGRVARPSAPALGAPSVAAIGKATASSRSPYNDRPSQKEVADRALVVQTSYPCTFSYSTSDIRTEAPSNATTRHSASQHETSIGLDCLAYFRQIG